MQMCLYSFRVWTDACELSSFHISQNDV